MSWRSEAQVCLQWKSSVWGFELCALRVRWEPGRWSWRLGETSCRSLCQDLRSRKLPR